MIAPLLLSMILAGSPPVEIAEDDRVLLLDLKLSEVSVAEGQLLTGRVAAALEAQGVSVVTITDLKELIDLQADQEMIDGNCDTEACLSEIASAMGTRLVVSGRVGAIGDLYLLQLAVNDTREADVIARHEIEADSLSALSRQTPAAVRALLGGEEESIDGFPWMLTAGGGLAAVGVVGAVGLGLAANHFDDVVLDSQVSASKKAEAKTRGLMALGGAAISGIVCIVGLSLMGAALLGE